MRVIRNCHNYQTVPTSKVNILMTLQIFLFLYKVEAYRTDPLVWHGGFKMKFATVFGDTMDKIKQLIPTIEWPFLVVHGDADKLTYIGGSQLLEKEAKSQDKEIKVGRFYLLNPYKMCNFVYNVYIITHALASVYAKEDDQLHWLF